MASNYRIKRPFLKEAEPFWPAFCPSRARARQISRRLRRCWSVCPRAKRNINCTCRLDSLKPLGKSWLRTKKLPHANKQQSQPLGLVAGPAAPLPFAQCVQSGQFNNLSSLDPLVAANPPLGRPPKQGRRRANRRQHNDTLPASPQLSIIPLACSRPASSLL